jgi:hypothetical protein
LRLGEEESAQQVRIEEDEQLLSRSLTVVKLRVRDRISVSGKMETEMENTVYNPILCDLLHTHHKKQSTARFTA